MGIRILTAILILCMIISCKKQVNTFENEGVITNLDFRACPCDVSCPCGCGGFVFHFTDMNDSTRVVIDNNSIIQLTPGTTYPVYLTVDWENTTRCEVKAMNILRYKIQ